ncbi:MAG: hypothetical protein ACRD3S_02275, partial [Terracidiphilus sp.]
VPIGPIELATWEELIKGLERAEAKIQNFPRTVKRDEQFDFYHGAMMEIKRFKNKFEDVRLVVEG